MASSLSFGSIIVNFSALFTLALATPTSLSSLPIITHWPIMQKVPSHSVFTELLVFFVSSFTLSSCFPTDFSTFLSQYSFSIDYLAFLGLENGLPIFTQNFPCSALLSYAFECSPTGPSTLLWSSAHSDLRF